MTLLRVTKHAQLEKEIDKGWKLVHITFAAEWCYVYFVVLSIDREDIGQLILSWPDALQ